MIHGPKGDVGLPKLRLETAEAKKVSLMLVIWSIR
jgi:hypothetical protein